MTINDILILYDKISEKLYTGNISEAFFLIKKIIKELKEWDLSIKLEELSSTYQNDLYYQLSAITEGNNAQNTTDSHIVLNLFLIAINAKELFMLKNSNLIEYEGQRLLVANKNLLFNDAVESFDTIHIAIQNYYSSLDSKLEIENFDIFAQNNLINDFQKIMVPLFGYIFLKNSISNKEIETIKAIVDDENIGIEARCIPVSALSISVLRFLNLQSIDVLLSLVATENIMVRQRVLVGLALIIAKYGKIIELDEYLMGRIASVLKENNCKNELLSILFQIIRTTQTGKISKHINEEIMPEIIKMTPKLKDQFDQLDVEEDSEQLIPKFEDILEGLEMTDKLEDFAELQMSGADVYAATFSQMKHFPFFSFIENWFMPFDKLNPHIIGLSKVREKLVETIAANPLLCNSDKFSFILNILQVPDNQLSAMEYAVKEEKERLEEISKSLTTKEDFSETNIVANHYILDLYRFFKFFPRPHNFNNPFLNILDIYQNKIFNKIFENKEDKEKIADYFYQFNHYKQSIDMYQGVVSEQEPTLEICQNMAYSFQQIGEYDNAINYYILAESLDKSNSWYLHRMAFCHRKMGNISKAIALYNAILEISKDDYKVMFRLAICHIENAQYEQALNVLFKIDYLKPDYPKIKSVLLLCLFYCRKFETGMEIAKKTLNDDSDVKDFITAGHIALSLNEITVSLSYYKKAIERTKQLKNFFDLFAADKDKLIENGVSLSKIDIIVELVLIDRFR